MLKYKEELASLDLSNINLIIAPSSIYLPLFKTTSINLCVQDIALNEKLHLTGDITFNQLKSLDVTYVLIGHFERRKYYQETEWQILTKITDALNNNFKVIYCIGETLEEKLRKVEYLTLEKQIAKIFNNLSSSALKNIIIAYEPTYLIGQKTPYDFLKIRSMIIFIKKIIQDYYGLNIPVVFGGNVNLDNIDMLNKISSLDGFIICSAIQSPQNIASFIQKITLK